jgi:5-methyltetrahydrofolate--homocysteine methyltransferase
MIQLQFTDEDWARIDRDTMAWWAGELERPLVWLTVTPPSPPIRGGGEGPQEKPYAYLSNYPLDMPADEVVDRHEPFLAATHFYGDSFPWWWINCGPGILAGFLGANVNSVVDPSETVWFSPFQQKDIQDINLEYDADNIWWKRVKELTSAAVERYEGRLAVSHTDLGGNLDVLASLLGTEKLLFDLIDCPEEVERVAEQITNLWLRYYDELDALIRPPCCGTSCWTPIWSSGKTYMLQCDFAYMISPAMFERFVLPDLIACCDHLDHGFYHLDGKGQIPHLDLLLSIPRLRGIQWIPGDGQPSPDQWLPVLKRIRDGGKLCQVFVSPEGARTIVEHLGGRGFLLVIEHSDREFVDPERALAFLKTLAQEDISRQAIV